MKLKSGYSHCPNCIIDFKEDLGVCPKCGTEDLEDAVSDEWRNMSEEEREAYNQRQEDLSWYDSVRMG